MELSITLPDTPQGQQAAQVFAELAQRVGGQVQSDAQEDAGEQGGEEAAPPGAPGPQMPGGPPPGAPPGPPPVSPLVGSASSMKEGMTPAGKRQKKLGARGNRPPTLKAPVPIGPQPVSAGAPPGGRVPGQ